MNIVPTNVTAADYCQAMQRGEIVVNREYQRSDKVWPPAARSYLIETMLLGYPMPKLSLYQVTDLKSKKTFKEIVDGQQRSIAILDFFKDRLRLSQALETDDVAGKTYSELDDEHKQRFLDYGLNCDVFVSTIPEEVREVFRRMNSYTIPLNPEEHRHAFFQGEFKWFIHRLARRFDESFVRIGLFGQKQLVRMTDMKLLAEICHGLLFGIQTTNKKKLEQLYKDKDKLFEEEHDCETRIVEALDQLLAWSEVYGGALMKPHIVYSLVLALIHMRRPVSPLQGVVSSPSLEALDREIVVSNMAQLAEALQNPEGFADFEEFVAACSSRTNVRSQRELRFKWLCKTLLPEAL